MGASRERQRPEERGVLLRSLTLPARQSRSRLARVLWRRSHERPRPVAAAPPGALCWRPGMAGSAGQRRRVGVFAEPAGRGTVATRTGLAANAHAEAAARTARS